VIVDFFTIDDKKNICLIGHKHFHCLYYLTAYLWLFYIVNTALMCWFLCKIEKQRSAQNLKKSPYSFWWQHSAFLFALFWCLADDALAIAQKFDADSDENDKELSSSYIISIIVFRMIFRVVQCCFLLVFKIRKIDLERIKGIRYYGKVLMLTNTCLILHYFLYEMRHKLHLHSVSDHGDDGEDADLINVFRMILAFFNIEFYLAATERIDLYPHLIIAEFEHEGHQKQTELSHTHHSDEPAGTVKLSITDEHHDAAGSTIIDETEHDPAKELLVKRVQDLEDDIRAKEEELVGERQRYEMKVQEYEKETQRVKQCETELKESRDENERLLSRVDELEQEVNVERGEVQRCKQEMAEKEKYVQMLEKQLVDEKEEYEIKLKESQQRMQECEKQTKLLEEQMRRYQQQREEGHGDGDNDESAHSV